MKLSSRTVLTGVAWVALAGVVFGGSRIGRRDTFDAAAPVTVVGADSIANLGATTLDSLLHKLPQVSAVNAGRGNDVLNLRNLGTRSLVLVDGRRFVAGGGIGYDEDPTLNGSDGTGFADLRLLTGGSVQRESMALAGVLGLNVRQYDDVVENADGDETTFDLNLSVGGIREFSPSVILESLVQAHYGDHGTLASGFIKPGHLHNEVLDWSTRTSVSYALGGKSLGDPGLEFSTYYYTQGYLESGGDEADVLRLGLGQEIRTNLSDGATLYGLGEIQFNSWDRWDVYDATVYRVGGGLRKEGDDWALDTLVGWENYDYDDLSERTDGLFAEINYIKAFSDRLDWSVKVNYGVQELYHNEGGSDFVDATGLLLGTRVQCAFNDRVSAGLSFAVLDLESDISNEDFHRGQIGLDARIEVGDAFHLTPGVLWTNNKDTPSGESDSFLWRLGANTAF